MTIQEIHSGTTDKIGRYDNEKPQTACRENPAIELTASNCEISDTESLPGGQEYYFFSTSRMNKLMEHAVDRQKDTLEFRHREKNGANEKEESTGELAEFKCKEYQGG